MSGTLDFDAEAAQRIERAYLTPDILDQREVVLEQLAVQPGESVLDIGVGPGLLALDLAREAGPEGSLLGIDTSAAMIEMTRQRCEQHPCAEFEVADACDLPCEDESIDCVVSTQVYEYVSDMPLALSELYRVLKPGGRCLILDTDYDSLVLRNETPSLTERILEAWDEHFVHRDLPRQLSGLLRAAGFERDSVQVLPLLNAEYHRDTFSYGLIRVMAGFAVGRAGITEQESQAWLEGLDRLGEQHDYFFSLNRYLFLARKS